MKRIWTLLLALLMMSATSCAWAQVYQRGDRGTEVETIQNALTKLKFYYADVTGHFGEKTETAVRKFQKKQGLTQDGVVGEETMRALCAAAGIDVPDGGGADGAAAGTTGGTTAQTAATATLPAGTMLKSGSRSDAVRKLQQDLTTLGYYSGTVTGHFGGVTENAVKKFQRNNGLSADGIAGAKTLAKIASALSGTSANTSTTILPSTAGGGSIQAAVATALNTEKTLQTGTRSDEVRKLQSLLASLGYFGGSQTGYFGEQTKSAVLAYQKAKGLSADGIAGKRTLSALNADAQKSAASQSTGMVEKTELARMAASVIHDNFFNWRRNYENGEYCTVYDYATGYSWTLRIMTKDKHMDAEPATAKDTETMTKAFGGKQDWTRKAVWVTFADGKTYMAATASAPHMNGKVKDNNFDGHLCVHFPIPMKTAEGIGPNATAFQKVIESGWEETRKMAM
ncbi:MAG: peptidoglycan-binding protein [Clostridia bacterium]|nr:peptidoglycan-binding protein [Clostridia bacterium]